MVFSKKTIVIGLIFAILINSSLLSLADSWVRIAQSSPNYLIILVHGINTTKAVFVGDSENGGERDVNDEKYSFGDLKGYLENQLGLKGYVYSYTFSERDGRIDLQGKELGKMDYFNEASTKGGRLKYIHADHKQLPPSVTGIKSGNSWLEQAREDFMKWRADNYYNGDITRVSTSEIPSKYIIIAHSMGGLAAREYIFSNYYNDDVAALITIDTPHMGSNAAWMLKQINDFDSNGKANAAALCLVLGVLASTYHLSPLDVYLIMCGILGYGMQEMIVDRLVADSSFGWYYGQPGVQDLDVDGFYINNLKNKKLKGGAGEIKVRLIASKGVPTPPKQFAAYGRFILGLPALETIFSSSFWNDIPASGKFMSIWLSMLLGTPINENGDFMVTKSSQLGEGVNSFNDPRIDVKKYEIEFNEKASLSNDAVMGIMLVADAAAFIGGGNPLFRATMIILGVAQMSMRVDVIGKEGYLDAHGGALKKVYEEKVIDKALEDFIDVGGKSIPVPESSGVVSAASIGASSGGFLPPSQTFALLSNKNRDGTDVTDYHAVTIEAIMESNNHLQSAPIEFNGQKKWVSAVTVKEPPIALKGVINTFLPKKLKSFEYSENFAAWKPVSAVDEWGNFTVSGLNLAEGQNVIAFKGESWIGNKMNQYLTITVNTIPMLPSQFQPAPNSYTNNPMPKIGVIFAKAAYSSQPLENINISSAKLIKPNGEEIDITPFIRAETGGGTYDRNIKVEYISDTPLSDGEYKILIVANSNVGMAQALWAFTVDTTPPMVKFLPSR